MSPSKSVLSILGGLVLLGALIGFPGQAPQEARTITAATMSLALPQHLGALQRPAVEFDHDRHSQALKGECAACHLPDGKGGIHPLMGRTTDGTDPSALMDLYHDRCLGCHRKPSPQRGQASGPVTCGGCHVRQARANPAWKPLAFDASLHYRHIKASGNKCDGCHHIYNEVAGKLEYRKGAESNCRDCHGEEAKGRVISARHAYHKDCIGCHQQGASKGQKVGPVECGGCHDPAKQQTIARVAQIPRLQRNQPDGLWLQAPGTQLSLVPFDHKAHEPVTSSCSTCHHKTLKACKECHTLEGKTEGGGVTLERAYHQANSERSCVGCHNKATAMVACQGCHGTMGPVASKGSCKDCHRGPRPGVAPSQEPLPAPIELTALPKASDDFPQRLLIGSLAKEYQPANLPHGKIVAHLDAQVRQSPLAKHFHGNNDTLCAGCHHHTPLGSRPPPCKSCHERADNLVQGRPALLTAYHQQCLGCHKRMNLKAQGCTDCHARATREAKQ